jgi:hypothetical protein
MDELIGQVASRFNLDKTIVSRAVGQVLGMFEASSNAPKRAMYS